MGESVPAGSERRLGGWSPCRDLRHQRNAIRCMGTPNHDNVATNSLSVTKSERTMSLNLSVAQLLANLERRIAFHRDKTALHARQVEHHQEQHALHQAE